MNWGVLILPGAAALLSWLTVGGVRRYALRRAVLDQPTARSSHRVPTPRGGGLGVVASVLATFLIASGGRSSPALAVALAGVALTAAIGWFDDHKSLGVRVRLAAHGLAAATLLPLALWPTAVPAWLGAFAAPWWLFWAVSAINVVNFMDGIDGLIGSQALVFGLHLAWHGEPGGSAALLGLCLAGAAAGFLLWNWPPARIFLGDVGSGPLGLLFVLGGLLLLREGGWTLVTAYLPLYFLFLDATWTLIRRARRGERLTEAHRSHLYQRLANGGWGHARVSLLYLSIAVLGAVVASVPDGAAWCGSYLAGGLAAWYLLDRTPAAAGQGVP